MSRVRTKQRPFRSRRIVYGLGIVILSVILSLAIWIAPTIAQPANQNAIVVDGTELFELGDTKNYDAEQRIKLANEQIQQAIESGESPDVEVSGETELPTIELNGRVLLTITRSDLVANDLNESTNLWEQAQTWEEAIERAIAQAQGQRQPGYLRFAALQSIGIMALALVLHWALGRFWRRTLTPELRAVTYIPDPDTGVSQYASLDLLLSVLLAIGRIGIWLAAGLYISNLFPWSRQWSYQLLEILTNSFISPIFNVGENNYSVVDLLILVGFFFALEITTKTVTNIVKTRVLRLTVSNRGTREVIAFVLRYSLLFIGALILLQIWGIDLSSLALLVSALGIGIGLGLQDIAKDIGSGFVLLFERPIRVGDFVQVGEYQGTVELIGARSTLIRTLDHVSLIVPNSRFLSAEVINWSHDNPISRLHLSVGVAYGSDLELTRSALLESAQGHPRVLSNPKPMVIFTGFGDSSLNLELLIWTAEPSKHLIIKSDLYFNIDAKLRQYGIEIPFPQHDLHVRSGNLPVELSTDIQQALQAWMQERNGKLER